MRSVFVALFVLGITVGHATWSQWANDGQNLWRASGTKTPLDLNIQWVKQMPFQNAPLVVDPAGNWYVAAQAYQQNVGSFDRIESYGTDGLRRWNSTQTFSYNSLSGVQPALSPDSKSLYVFSACMLYSIDTNTGKLNWAFSMDTCSGNNVPGIIGVDSEGTIFIRNGTRLLGVDPNTIGLAVVYNSNPTSNYNNFNSRMATGQGYIAWLVNSQQFTVFDKKTGKIAWTANITTTDPTRVYLDMTVMIVPDQKIALVTSAQIYRGDNYNTSVNAYDLTTGNQVWHCVMSSLRGSSFLAPFALSQDGQSVWALYYQGQYRYIGMLDLKTHTLKDFAEHDLSSAQPRLVVDPSGDVIYTMDAKVLQMSTDQSFSRNYTVNQSTALATQYQFNQPVVLAVSDGSLFVGYGYSHNVVVRFSASGTKPSAPTFTSADPAVYAITIRFELPIYPAGTGGLVLTDLIVQYSDDGVNWVTYPIDASSRLSPKHCIQVTQLKGATKYMFRAAVLNTAGQGDWGTYSIMTVSDTNLCPALVYLHLPADNQPGVIDGVQPTTPSMAVIAPSKNPGGQPSYPGPDYAVSFQASNVSCRVCPYFTSKFNMYVASNGSGIGIRYWFQVDFTSDGVWDVDQLYPVPSTGHFYYPLPADGSWQHMGEPFNFTSDFNRGTIRVTVWNVIGGFESAISFGQSGVFSQANFNFWSKTTVLPC